MDFEICILNEGYEQIYPLSRISFIITTEISMNTREHTPFGVCSFFAFIPGRASSKSEIKMMRNVM